MKMVPGFPPPIVPSLLSDGAPEKIIGVCLTILALTTIVPRPLNFEMSLMERVRRFSWGILRGWLRLMTMSGLLPHPTRSVPGFRSTSTFELRRNWVGIISGRDRIETVHGQAGDFKATTRGEVYLRWLMDPFILLERVSSNEY